MFCVLTPPERLFGSLTLWEVLERLEESLPGTAAFVRQVRGAATTPHGRAALWIRQALRERRLAEYLSALRFHPELVARSYEPDAPFASDEFASALLLQLETAAALDFHFQWQEAPSLDASPLVYTHVTLPELSNAGALVQGGQQAAAERQRVEAVSGAVARVRETLKQVLLECGPHQLLDDRAASVPPFLAALHHALALGLRPALLTERHPWDVFRELPAASAQVVHVEERYATPTLRLHALFRLALNASSLASLVAALAANRALLEAQYTDEALLRNGEDTAVLLALLDGLAAIKCCFSTDTEPARRPPASAELPVRRKAAAKKRTPLIDGASPLPGPEPAAVPASLPAALHPALASPAPAPFTPSSVPAASPYLSPASAASPPPSALPSVALVPPSPSAPSLPAPLASSLPATAPLRAPNSLAAPVAAPVALSPSRGASVADAMDALAAMGDELAQLEPAAPSSPAPAPATPHAAPAAESPGSDDAYAHAPALSPVRLGPQVIGPVPTPPPVHIAFLVDPPPSPQPQAPPAAQSTGEAGEGSSGSDDDDDEGEGDSRAEEPAPPRPPSEGARSGSAGTGAARAAAAHVRRVVDDKPVADTSAPAAAAAAAGGGHASTAYVREIYSSRTAAAPSACATCSAPVGGGLLDRLRDTCRFCYYTGLWYCAECHHNARAVLPARAVLRWDLRAFPVSLAAQSLLADSATRPLLNVGALNEALYQTAPLAAVKELRDRLVQLGEYVHTCAERSALVAGLGPRAYMLDSVHAYSLRDLMEAHEGKLLGRLQAWVRDLTAHVVACAHCRGKGFVCERCLHPRLIFPFQPATLRCLQCRALYHAACFSHDFQCVKCARIRAVRGKLRPVAASAAK